MDKTIQELEELIEYHSCKARGHLKTALSLDSYYLAAQQAKSAKEEFEKASNYAIVKNSLQSESK